MTRRVLGTALLGLVLGVGACGGGGDDENGGGSTVERLCAKAAECNFLETGQSRQACVEETNLCLNTETPTDRADWDRLIRQCLDTVQGCTAIANCYANVPGC